MDVFDALWARFVCPAPAIRYRGDYWLSGAGPSRAGERLGRGGKGLRTVAAKWGR
jgi:hypothetical protein